MSSKSRSGASRSLPIFGVRARRNMDGWGIGFFRNGEAHVEKSADRIYVPGRLHDSFQRLARVIQSPTVVAHIRLQTSGKKDECHSHPFVLRFLETDWIFAHNGKAPAIEGYRTRGERLEAESDSARAFEFIRDHLLFYYRGDTVAYGLFEALRRSVIKLLSEYPGNYNFLLSSRSVLFALTNHRYFMVLKGSRQLEDGLLLTTIEEGLSPEPWEVLKAEKRGPGSGLLLLVAGGELILRQALNPHA